MAKPDLIADRGGGAPVHCAIYTRKSSEEGLEQDFNSLHAQREACEAYIKSQKHEGWPCIADAAAVFDAVSSASSNTEHQGELVAQAAALAGSWPDLPADQQRRILSTLITRIEVDEDGVTLHVVPARIAAILQEDSKGSDHSDADGAGAAEAVVLSIPVRLQRIGQGTQLIVRAGTSSIAKPNAALIKLLARAHQLQHQPRHEKIASIDELASRAQMNASYATRLLRLPWLAPDITQAILHGRHPPALTADKLMRAAPVPVDWQAQRVALGFG